MAHAAYFCFRIRRRVSNASIHTRRTNTCASVFCRLTSPHPFISFTALFVYSAWGLFYSYRARSGLSIATHLTSMTNHRSTLAVFLRPAVHIGAAGRVSSGGCVQEHSCLRICLVFTSREGMEHKDPVEEENDGKKISRRNRFAYWLIGRTISMLTAPELGN